MKFSIVMPLYLQGEKLVRRAIYSILYQTYPNFELIICDNGNKDEKVIEMINELKETENRVIYFKTEKNVGWPKAISLCLERATGDYMGFIADDDYLEPSALGDVYSEIRRNDPDVVWMGQSYDVFQDDKYKTVSTQVPQYKVLNRKRETCEYLISFLSDVYYNSMQHYIKMDLLKKNEIDFYNKYGGDCGAMTKVLSVAEKMVILNKAPYHLTLNTSINRGKYQEDFCEVFASQWICITELLLEQKYCKDNVFAYVAGRIEKNHLGTLRTLCDGAPCRTKLFENIQMSFNERFLEIERTFSDKAIAEMICFSGREEYYNEMLDSLLNLLNLAQESGENIEDVTAGSLYLRDFVFGLMDCVNGTYQITKQMTVGRLKRIIKCIDNPNNLSMFGYEAILKLTGTIDVKTGIVFDILRIRRKKNLLIKHLKIKYGLKDTLENSLKSNKLGSIVCYCHNTEKSVPVIFNSILDKVMDLKNIEVIFVNNASTDGTYQCLAKLEKEHENSIVVVNLEESLSKQEASQIGISYASTDYIGMADASDWQNEA